MLMIKIKKELKNQDVLFSFSLRHMNSSSQSQVSKNFQPNNHLVEEYKHGEDMFLLPPKNFKANKSRMNRFNNAPEVTHNTKNNRNLLNKLDQTDSLDCKEKSILFNKNLKSDNRRIDDFNHVSEITHNINTNNNLRENLNEAPILDLNGAPLLRLNKNEIPVTKNFQNSLNSVIKGNHRGPNLGTDIDPASTHRLDPKWGTHTTQSHFITAESDKIKMEEKTISRINENQSIGNFRGEPYYDPNQTLNLNQSSFMINQEDLVAQIAEINNTTRKIINSNRTNIVEVKAQLDDLVAHQKKTEKVFEKIDEISNSV